MLHSCASFDYHQWIFRALIILVCAGFGIALLVKNLRHSRKISKIICFIFLQIALSFIVPISVGKFLQWRKITGALSGCSSDWDQFAYEISTIKSGAMIAPIIMGSYVFLTITTTLTIQKLVMMNSTSKHQIASKN